MLADVERIDPYVLGEDTLLDHVANDLVAADRLTIKSGGDSPRTAGPVPEPSRPLRFADYSWLVGATPAPPGADRVR